jgi:hypothetical protein
VEDAMEDTIRGQNSQETNLWHYFALDGVLKTLQTNTGSVIEKKSNLKEVKLEC